MAESVVETHTSILFYLPNLHVVDDFHKLHGCGRVVKTDVIEDVMHLQFIEDEFEPFDILPGRLKFTFINNYFAFSSQIQNSGTIILNLMTFNFIIGN